MPLPGLSPIDGGLLVLREIERRLGADRLAVCVEDRRDRRGTVHTLADIIRFRLLMIAAGYEDATTPPACASIRCSRWRSTGGRRTGACVRSRHLAAGEPAMRGRCCVLAVPWSISTARSSGKCRGGSPSTSTIPSMRRTAASNCGCSKAYYDDYGFQPIVVFDGEGRFDAAGSWEPGRPDRRPRRGRQHGTDTPFIVTNLGHGSGRSLYQDLYCRRGQAENHIKAWKTHVAADRTSCPKATANQFRLFLHAVAYLATGDPAGLNPKSGG